MSYESSYVDGLYITNVSGRLDKFARRSGSLYNFRCPLCGDSKTKKSKARAFLFQEKGVWRFHCHNCNQPLSLKEFLERVDPSLAAAYRRDRAFATAPVTPRDEPQIANPSKPTLSDKPLLRLLPIADLPETHPARVYIEGAALYARIHGMD